MNDANQPSPAPEPNKGNETERTKQATVAGWTAGVSAFFALGTLAAQPAWPTAIGVAAVAAMVAAACYFILKRG
jgi:amino acid transporter